MLTKEQIQQKIAEHCEFEYKEITDSDLKTMPKHMVQSDSEDDEIEETLVPEFVKNNVNTTRNPGTKLKGTLRNCQYCQREIQSPGPEIVIQISTGKRGTYLRERCKTCRIRKNPFNSTFTLPVHEANQCYLVFEQYDLDTESTQVQRFTNMGLDEK